MSRLKYLIGLVVIIALLGGGYVWLGQSQTQEATPAKSPTKTETSATSLKQFDKSRYSLKDPASLWVVANKHRSLEPKTYVPADLVVPDVLLRTNITGDERQLRQETAAALKDLFDAASRDNVTLNLQSGYRSYNFQVNLYNSYVSRQGQAVADSQSARAGYSEHQTGLAADVGGISQPSCNVEACFAGTTEGKWVAANAHTYGFVVRYPEAKTNITGYTYEPWHLRYVGRDLARQMHKDNVQTLEEFFDLGAAPDYN